MFEIWRYSYWGGAGDSFAAILDNNLDNKNNGFGIGAFFDATYVEIGMDFVFSSLSPNTGDTELKSTYFGFTILGKFPFGAGPVTFFPLAGIDYQIFLSGKVDGFTIERDDMSGDYEGMYDAFSLFVGVGVDFDITSKLYLRGEVLINFKIEDDFDKMLKKAAKENDVNFSGVFTMGPRVSIGVGYRF
jgi:outer membrane protein W